MLDKQAMEAILEAHTKDGGASGKSLADWLVYEIAQAEDIRKQIALREYLIVQHQKEALAKIAKERAAIRELQLKCPHWSTRYHGDASRNNDSWTECNICGGSV